MDGFRIHPLAVIPSGLAVTLSFSYNNVIPSGFFVDLPKWYNIIISSRLYCYIVLVYKMIFKGFPPTLVISANSSIDALVAKSLKG